MYDYLSLLYLSESSQLQLSSTSRFDTINQYLSNPIYQFPSLLFSIRRKSKSAILRQIFPHNNLSRKAQYNSFVNLYINNTITAAAYPLFFVESNISKPIASERVLIHCHEIKTYLLPQSEGLETTTVASSLYNRLIFPFVDVICIFVDDFTGLSEVYDLVASWMKQSSLSSLPITVRPRIIIVQSTEPVQ